MTLETILFLITSILLATGKGCIDFIEFECIEDESCIPMLHRCDGIKHCPNGEDEGESCLDYECLYLTTKCDDGRYCVRDIQLCDGVADCQDFSDEIDCRVCDGTNVGRTPCLDESSCLSQFSFCDGTPHCDSGEDEEQCFDRCNAPENMLATNFGPNKVKQTVTCPFGIGGIYCNETCSDCISPACVKHPFEKDKLYYTIYGDYFGNNTCVPKNTEYLVLKNSYYSTINYELFSNLQGNLISLNIQNISYDTLNKDFLKSLKSKLIFLTITQINFDPVIPDISNFLDLQALDISYTDLKSVSQQMLRGSRRLLRLSLFHNRIQFIDEDAFVNQERLQELLLGFNEITGDVFLPGLTQLIYLDLSHNCIDHIRQDMFENLHSLQRVILINNPITQLPIPQLKGIVLYGRSRFDSLTMFTPKHVKCEDFVLSNDLQCGNDTQTHPYNEIVFLDTRDDCANVTCSTNSTKCIDIISEGVCVQNTENQCLCGFINFDVSCITNPGQDVTCTRQCRCEDANSHQFVCDNLALTQDILTENTLCLPIYATELTLINVEIDFVDFESLLARFETLEKISLNKVSINVTDLSTVVPGLLKNVKILSLVDMDLTEFPKEALEIFPALQQFVMSANDITVIPNLAFENNFKLRMIDMRENNIEHFHSDALKNLENLTNFDVSNNLVMKYPNGLFKDQEKLKTVHGDQFTICCLAELRSTNLTVCTPQDSISSCDRLVANSGLRVLIWIQAFLSTIGNLVALYQRYADYRQANMATHDRVAKTNTFLVGFLAIADLIMGVYLFIIASSDAAYAGGYYKHASDWVNSPACKTAGILSLFSSQASVFTLTLITITRLLSVTFPFCYRTINSVVFQLTAGFMWMFALLLAFAPLMGFTTLKAFFSTSGVCLPSWYTSTQEDGWDFTLFLIIINTLSFLVIVSSYFVLVRKVYMNERKTKTSHKTTGSTLGVRVLLIILTDFLCWFPICIAAIVSLGMGGFTKEVYNVLYPWTAILLLPINSAINPIIYTLLPSLNLRKIKKKFRVCFAEDCLSTTPGREYFTNGSTTTSNGKKSTFPKTLDMRKISVPRTMSTAVYENPGFDSEEENN